MNKTHSLLIVCNLIFLFSFSPAFAQSQTTYPPYKKKFRLNLIKLSGKIAGTCTGFVVGTPVCFVKKLAEETTYGTENIVNGFTDDKGSKLLTVPVAIAWLPAATVTSFLEAPVYSFHNAVTADEPFSKEQFSLYDFDLSQ